MQQKNPSDKTGGMFQN